MRAPAVAAQNLLDLGLGGEPRIVHAVERQQRRAVDEARDVLRRLVREPVGLLDQQLHGQAPVARELLLRRPLHGPALALLRFWFSLPHAAPGAGAVPALVQKRKPSSW